MATLLPSDQLGLEGSIRKRQLLFVYIFRLLLSLKKSLIWLAFNLAMD